MKISTILPPSVESRTGVINMSVHGQMCPWQVLALSVANSRFCCCTPSFWTYFDHYSWLKSSRQNVSIYPQFLIMKHCSHHYIKAFYFCKKSALVSFSLVADSQFPTKKHLFCFLFFQSSEHPVFTFF